MSIIRIFLATVLCFPAAFAAEGTFPVEDGFLSIDFSQFTETRVEEHGLDLLYAPAGWTDRLAKYNKLMIDQPEIWIDADSKYKGVKPDNVKAIADLIRDTLIQKALSRGREVVEEPGPDVLYLRVALTDLYLKNEKRGILGYVPIGAAVKLVADQVRDMMSKVDIIEMAIQGELQDSESGEVLLALIIKRGARKDKASGQKEQRMEFGEFREVVQMYGARLSCRLDNAKLAESQQIECLDMKVLEAAGYL